MSKRPAFQFYPGDWKRDAALQSCSLAARGLWIEMMCLMHQGTPYGYLKLGKNPVDLSTLSSLISAKKSLVSKLLCELEQAEIFSRDENGVIYSKRMVKDEELRIRRASGGIKSIEHPNTFKPKSDNIDSSKGTLDGPDEGCSTVVPPAFASSSSYTKDKAKDNVQTAICTPSPFEKFWQVYPIKQNKKKANEIWQRNRLNEKADLIIADVTARKERHAQWQNGYIPHATTYLNGERWNDEIMENGYASNQQGAQQRNQRKSQSEATWDFLAKAAGIASGENIIELESYLPAEVPKLISE